MRLEVEVIWFDAPESKYHFEGDEKVLPEMPKVENAWRIICWIISGLIGGLGANGCEDMDEAGEADATELESEEARVE